MKLITVLILFGSCNGSDTKAIKGKSETTNITKQDSIKIIETVSGISKLSPRQYAEGVIMGEIQPTDNKQTFDWLDSLQSDNKATRQFAFTVYKAMALKSDGSLSEAICGYIKSYFQMFPKEFLANYSKLDNEHKYQVIESIAFEFYASGTDNKKDLDEYFKEILIKCTDCISEDITIQEDIRVKVERQVRQLAD